MQHMTSIIVKVYSQRGLYECETLKSPAPNSILSTFMQKQWDVCGEDMSWAALNVLQGGYMVKKTNQTLIALIPKVIDPS